MYFVSNNQGGHAFSNNLSDHNRNVANQAARLNRAGSLRWASCRRSPRRKTMTTASAEMKWINGWSAAAAIFRAGWRFMRAYLLRLGFLDGYPGFFIAASTAYSTLVRHSRLFEHSQPAPPPCAPPKSP